MNDLKTHDLEKIFTKLKVQHKKSTHHVRGFVVEGGKVILPLRYSFGSKGLKGRVLHKFRKSLHLSERQLSDLVRCTFSRDDLLKLLGEKGIF